MDLEQLFSMAGLVAMSGWLLLVILPRNSIVQLVAGVAIPLVLSVGYLILIVLHFRGTEGGFGSLADVAALFQKPELLLAGWIHYLAFDLFIGAWETRDAQRSGLPHLVVIPCLVMTFMLGPIGLLFYFAIRTAKLRAVPLEDVA
ncbi:MAG: ABA4-like family protein [Vicinamibacterales bacterium]